MVYNIYPSEIIEALEALARVIVGNDNVLYSLNKV